MFRFIGLPILFASPSRYCVFVASLCLAIASPLAGQEAEGKRGDDDKDKARTLAEGMVGDIESLFAADFGDTDVSFLENRNKAFEKLSKKYEGKTIKISFPVENISGGQGKYVVSLGDPTFPGPLEYSFASRIEVNLTKKEAMKVDDSSVVEVSGKVKLRPSAGYATLSTQALQNGTYSRISLLSWRSKKASVELAIDKPSIRVVINDENGEKKGAINGKPLDSTRTNKRVNRAKPSNW